MNSCNTYLENLNRIEKMSLAHVPYYIIGFAVAGVVRPADAESTVALFGITFTFHAAILCSKKALLLCSSRQRTEIATRSFSLNSNVESSPPPTTQMQKTIFFLAIIFELGCFFAACKHVNENEIGPVIPIVIAASLFLFKGIAGCYYRKEMRDGLGCGDPEKRPLVNVVQ